jgi:hypothetical protein
MKNFITRFFQNRYQNKIFGKEYRSAYKNLWINELRDYTP